jgi:hypothetical protein
VAADRALTGGGTSTTGDAAGAAGANVSARTGSAHPPISASPSSGRSTASPSPAFSRAAGAPAGVTRLGATQAQVSFKPTTAAKYVIVHYLVNNANQQNVTMTNNGGTWTQTVSGLSAGSVLTYWFTYEKNGPQYDSPQYTYTQT